MHKNSHSLKYSELMLRCAANMKKNLTLFCAMFANSKFVPLSIFGEK